MTTLTDRGVGLAARVARVTLGALVTLGAACSASPPAATASPAASGAPAASDAAGAASTKASLPGDPCASGGPQVILAARVGIGQRGRAPESWVDFEVRGPQLDAQRFCEAVVQRELATVYPEETHLVARVERSCQATAMAEPKGTPPFLLAERKPIDAIDALLRGLPKGCTSASAGVNATERRLSGYEDQASCEQAQKVILSRRSQATEDAKAKAAEWLAGTITEQEKRLAEVCAAPGSAPCAEQKEVVRLLKSRAAKVAADAQAAATPVENPGPVLGGPICRPR